MDFKQLQSVIDENKLDIPDALYLQLSNICGAEFKKKEIKDGFYEVKYLFQEPHIEDTTTFHLMTRSRVEVIKLQHRQYKLIRDGIKEKGYYVYHSCCHSDHVPLERLSHHRDAVRTHLTYFDSEAEGDQVLNFDIVKQAIVVGIKKA